MSAAELLAYAESIGHRVRLNGAGPVLLGKPGPETTDLVDALKARKADVVALLEERARFVPESEWTDSDRYVVEMLAAGAWQPGPLRVWKW